MAGTVFFFAEHGRALCPGHERVWEAADLQRRGGGGGGGGQHLRGRPEDGGRGRQGREGRDHGGRSRACHWWERINRTHDLVMKASVWIHLGSNLETCGLVGWVEVNGNFLRDGWNFFSFDYIINSLYPSSSKKFRAGHFRYFLNILIIKNDSLHFLSS